MRVEAAEIAGSRIRIGYTLDLEYQVLDPAVFVFNVHAARTRQQRVLEESVALEPAANWRVETERALGNRLLRLRAGRGPLHLRYAATVEIAHYMSEPQHVVAGPLDSLPAHTLRFLRPSRYCQSDQLQRLAWQEFGHLAPGHAQAMAVCLWVRSHIEFRVATSNAATSAVDTISQRVGVCRDFAHLMIALLRGLNYPARFVTGVDFGAERSLGPPDFHAYVEAYIGDRWWLFDPTGICVLTGLPRIGTGRDAADVSFATMFGSVRGAVPKLQFAAIDDPGAGISTPRPTNLAVSTVQR